MKSEERINNNKIKEDKRKTTDETKNKSAEQKQKDAAVAWTWKGWFLFILGKVEVANKCYDKAIELDPKNIYGWGGKFWTCCILGKVHEVIESAEKVIDINPENKYAWSIKSWTYFILGKIEESLECYDKYIELDKLDKKDYNVVRASNYQWITKGYLLYLLEEFDKAIECLNKALEVNPMDKKYTLALKGEILNSIGKYEEAIKCYDKVIDEKSRYASYDDLSNAFALILKGNALSNLGKYEEAIKCYDKSLEINPNNPILILINKSGILFSNDASNTGLGKISAFSNLDIEVILEIYEKLLENSPKNAYAWTWKGNILSNLGKYEEAIKCYDKSLEINPNYALAQTNRGNALSNLGKYEEAIKCYDKSLEINPNYALAHTNKEILIDKYWQFKIKFSFFKYISSTSAYTNYISVKKLTYIEVTTRDYVPDNEKLQNFSALLFKCVLMKLDVWCPPEIVIYVHNFNKDSTDTKEEFNRIQTSLNDTNYKTPLIGLSWNSHTGYFTAQKNAKDNRPILANFITEFKKENNCPKTDIRFIAHALGAAVVKSTLDNLNSNHSLIIDNNN